MKQTEALTMTAPRGTLCRTVKTKTAAAIGAMIAAVALPQVFHLLGAALGLGPALGQTLLPMHLPVLLVGLLAGPMAGLAAGAVSPVLSALLSGMPALPILPFMIVELAGYGLTAGLLTRVKMPVLGKLVLAQIAGRLLRAGVAAFAFYALGNTMASAAAVWTGVQTGLPGLILQWVSIPLILLAAERAERRDG